MARPGGNLTGVTIVTAELNPKRLELLSELVPQAYVIALLVNPNNASAERVVTDVQEAARARGVQLHILKASNEGAFETAFASLAQRQAGALLVGNDPFFFHRRNQLVALAARHAIPAMYEWREFAAAGGLISYGTSIAGMVRIAGAYVGRILASAKPADLPVQEPTKFELVINLKTAEALGLVIPSRPRRRGYRMRLWSYLWHWSARQLPWCCPAPAQQRTPPLVALLNPRTFAANTDAFRRGHAEWSRATAITDMARSISATKTSSASAMLAARAAMKSAGRRSSMAVGCSSICITLPQ
jgi:ABC transporter substrate binding protein